MIIYTAIYAVFSIAVLVGIFRISARELYGIEEKLHVSLSRPSSREWRR